MAQTLDPEAGAHNNCNLYSAGFQASQFTSVDKTSRPDPELAVSRCHILAATNHVIRAFLRDGTPTGLDMPLFQEGSPPSGPPGFWAPLVPTPCYYRIIDPEVQYDAAIDRFWAIAYEEDRADPNCGVTVRYLALAVSLSNNPNGAWNTFRITSAVLPDAPHLALDSSRVYLANNVGVETGWALAILDKLPLLDPGHPQNGGVLPEALVTRLSSPPAGPQRRVDLAVNFGVDDAAPQYMIADARKDDSVPGWPEGTWDTIPLYAVTVAPSVAAIELFPPIQVPLKYRRPVDAPQPSPGIDVRGNGDLGFFHSAVYRNGSLWAVHAVRRVTEFDPQPPEATVLRWYEFHMNEWAGTGDPPMLYQSGEIVPPFGLYAYRPSIGVDGLGNVVITFHASGDAEAPNSHISIWRAVRCWTQPLDYFGPPEPVKLGQAPYVPTGSNPGDKTHWGDFSGTDPAPEAPTIFFGHDQIPFGAAGPTNIYETWVSRHDVCSLDFNGDGQVSMADVQAYQWLFMEGSPKADYVANGVIELADFEAFMIDMFEP